jgi:hypothetical protein
MTPTRLQYLKDMLGAGSRGNTPLLTKQEGLELVRALEETNRVCDELRRILGEERVQQDAIAEQKGRAYFRALAAREREKLACLVDDADEDLPKQMLAAEIRGKCFKHGNDPDTCAQCAELRLKDYSHHAGEDDA